MESLNDIIERYIMVNSQRREGKYFVNGLGHKAFIKKDFDLKLPKIYEVEIHSENGNYRNIFKSIGQFELEFMDANPKEVLFQTKLEKELQILNIFHDGNKIPKESLDYLNKYLDWISKDRIDWTQSRHGNLIAGQMLKSLRGRVYLENLGNDKYNVKTSVQIPFK